MFTIKGQSIPASVTNLLMGGPDLKMVLQGLRNYSLAPGLLAIQINSWADLYMYLRWTSEQSQGSNKPLAISSTSAFISLATAPHLKLPPSLAIRSRPMLTLELGSGRERKEQTTSMEAPSQQAGRG